MYTKKEKFIDTELLNNIKKLHRHYIIINNKPVLNAYKSRINDLGLSLKILIKENKTEIRFISNKVLKKKG